MKSLITSIVLVFGACSSDPLEPGAGDAAGAGTGTLLVEGRVSASPRINNARTPNDFDTEFSVRVELNQQNVSSGSVTIKSSFVDVALQYDGGNNRWEGTALGYDEVYRLDIVSGADNVRGVIVDGPDIHYFTAPTAGASLDSTIANPLSWSRDDKANIITFESDQIGRITITDTGTYTMGPGTLRAERDQARPNTIEVRRTNHVTPAGAVGGSEFAVTVENDIEVVAQPNPAL